MGVTDLSSPETILGATKAVRLSGDAGPTHRGLMNLFTWFHLLSYKLQVASCSCRGAVRTSVTLLVQNIGNTGLGFRLRFFLVFAQLLAGGYRPVRS